MSMATSFFYIYAMATTFFYIYVMTTSFFYIYVIATSFLIICRIYFFYKFDILSKYHRHRDNDSTPNIVYNVLIIYITTK